MQPKSHMPLAFNYCLKKRERENVYYNVYA